MLGNWRLALSLLGLYCLPCNGQPVLSAHAGLILFTEGAVFLDGKPYVPRTGRWAEVPENVTLQTQDGKADVLLAPGVFLRMGAQSGIRLMSNKLVDVQVEFLGGSAIIESTQQQPENSVTFLHRKQQIRIGDRGRYRINSEPGQIVVHSGQLELRHDETEMILAEHHLFSFDSSEVKETLASQQDALDYWDQERQRVDDPAPAPIKPLDGWKRRLARLLIIPTLPRTGL